MLPSFTTVDILFDNLEIISIMGPSSLKTEPRYLNCLATLSSWLLTFILLVMNLIFRHWPPCHIWKMFHIRSSPDWRIPFLCLQSEGLWCCDLQCWLCPGAPQGYTHNASRKVIENVRDRRQPWRTLTDTWNIFSNTALEQYCTACFSIHLLNSITDYINNYK